MNFVTLQVASAYSLLQSTIAIDEYVALGKKLGYDALALTDEGVMHGSVAFYQICNKNNIKPIIGCTFEMPGIVNQANSQKFIVYAKNKAGYHSLVKLSTLYQQKGYHADLVAEINRHSSDLKVLLAYKDSEWGQYVQLHQMNELNQFFTQIRKDFATIEMALGISSEQVATGVYDVIKKVIEPFYITPIAHQVTYYLRTEDDFSWQVLQALAKDEKIEDYEREISGPYYLHETYAMQRLFREKDALELMEQHLLFIKDLEVEIDFGKPLLPKYDVPTQQISIEYLKDQCETGLRKRGKFEQADYQKRLAYELQVIDEMGFADYFLIIWDIMAYAHQADIQTGPGRGSAAGSLVAYVLEITQVDPIENKLIFERFLNRERFTMPDIDLDFPDNKREMILKYVLQKYGQTHVAQIATFGTLAAKQAVRDVGRVLGLTTVELAQWSKAIPNQLKIKLKTAFQQSRVLRELVNQSKRNQLLFDTALKVEGLPRHMSTHAAGVVISDVPLVENVPLIYREGNLPITQYTMEYVERIGLLKMDFLGLKNLTILYDALQFVHKMNQQAIDIYQIDLKDPKTLELFGLAHTNGVFQFESDGIKRVLSRVKPNSLDDIVAVNALYRPGPMEQISTFIKRKHHQETIQYMHPDLAEILGDTYGVMVYQEQVLQVASKMAGFTLGEADILRRAIGKKKNEIIEQERIHFITGAKEKGYDEKTASEVYSYIERFADYGFNKSHSYAYALLAYQLAYLKANYPAAFWAAILKSLNASSKKAQEYLLEAKQAKVVIFPPSVQESMMDFSVNDDGIVIGLSAIKGLRKEVILHIIQNRLEMGRYKDFIDFCLRLGKKYCKKETLDALIYSGALDCFGEEREELIASIPGVIGSFSYSSFQLSLAGEGNMIPKIIKSDVTKMSLIQKLEKEIEYLGYPVSSYPTEKYNAAYQLGEVITIKDCFIQKTVSVLGVVMAVTKRLDSKGNPIAYATLRDSTGEIGLVLFSREYPKYYQLLNEGDIVQVRGKVAKDYKGNQQIQIQKIVSEKVFSEKINDTKKKCYLKISEANNSIEVMDAIKEVVHNYPGYTPIYVYLESNKQLVKLHYLTGIHPSNLAKDNLEKIIGIGNVKIIE